MRTEEQKQEMIDKLESQKETLPQFSLFGDNNWQQINDAIRVIDEDLNDDDIYSMYENEEEDTESINYCLQVREWLDGADNEDEIITD